MLSVSLLFIFIPLILTIPGFISCNLLMLSLLLLLLLPLLHSLLSLTLSHTPTHANIHALTSTLSRSHTYYKISTEAKNFSHIGTQLLLHVPITWSMNLISEQEEMV